MLYTLYCTPDVAMSLHIDVDGYEQIVFFYTGVDDPYSVETSLAIQSILFDGLSLGLIATQDTA